MWNRTSSCSSLTCLTFLGCGVNSNKRRANIYYCYSVHSLPLVIRSKPDINQPCANVKRESTETIPKPNFNILSAIENHCRQNDFSQTWILSHREWIRSLLELEASKGCRPNMRTAAVKALWSNQLAKYLTIVCSRRNILHNEQVIIFK